MQNVYAGAMSTNAYNFTHRLLRVIRLCGKCTSMCKERALKRTQSYMNGRTLPYECNSSTIGRHILTLVNFNEYTFTDYKIICLFCFLAVCFCQVSFFSPFCTACIHSDSCSFSFIVHSISNIDIFILKMYIHLIIGIALKRCPGKKLFIF